MFRYTSAAALWHIFNGPFLLLGTGVSYLSPLWPYNVTVDISLDGATADFVSLLDPAYSVNAGAPDSQETVQSVVRWQMDNLMNGPHTVVVSASPGGQYVVVDGFMCVSISLI